MKSFAYIHPTIVKSNYCIHLSLFKHIKLSSVNLVQRVIDLSMQIDHHYETCVKRENYNKIFSTLILFYGISNQNFRKRICKMNINMYLKIAHFYLGITNLMVLCSILTKQIFNIRSLYY